MSADKTFSRWMRTLSVLFITLLAYIIIADRHAPLTTESRVQGYVVQLAPEVTGNVINVQVSNNQTVHKGDLLFKIDDYKYQIALKQAEYSLQGALEQEANLYAQQSGAYAAIERAKANLELYQTEYRRTIELSSQELVSQSTLDQALANYNVAKATLEAERQNLTALQAQLGSAPGQSATVLQAKNRIESARLDLKNTQVLAPSDGVVTNLQLEVGSMAHSNEPLITFIPTGKLWVAADFREKSIAKVNNQYAALVTFDALPGQIYAFDLTSRDYGVAAAQQRPDGSLAKVEGNNRWVRDAQRARVNLTSAQPLPTALFVGSRATAVLYPKNSDIWQTLARAQIRFNSALHFLY